MSGSTNYSRFDSIVDSDDSDDGSAPAASPGPALTASMPGHIQQTMSKINAASARGDEAAVRAAQAELEQQMSHAPPEFREAFETAKKLETKERSKTESTLQAGRATLAKARQAGVKGDESADALDAQLQQLEEAQNLLAKMGDDPAQAGAWLEHAGLCEADLLAAEQADDPHAAMQRLAQRAMEKTLGRARKADAAAARQDAEAAAEPDAAAALQRAEALAAKRQDIEKRVAAARAAQAAHQSAQSAAAAAAAGEGGASSSGDPEEEATAAARGAAARGGARRGGARDAAIAKRLAAQQQRMAAAEEELAAQRAAAARAAEAVARARTELATAEQQREEQGRKVDASVAAAATDLESEAKVRIAEEKTRAAFVDDLRERGNAAMRRGDHLAANNFYMEALFVPSVPDAVRVKLLGNRAACLLAMKQPQLAKIDALEAVCLAPDVAKLQYRLGVACEQLGDDEGAAEALGRALALEPGSAEIGARLDAVRARMPAAPTKSPAEPAPSPAPAGFAEAKARADGLFVGGEHAKAAEAYSELIEDDDTEEEAKYNLLANRSACFLLLAKHGSPYLDWCVRDCEAALRGVGKGLSERAERKVRLRRTEARERLASGEGAKP